MKQDIWQKAQKIYVHVLTLEQSDRFRYIQENVIDEPAVYQLLQAMLQAEADVDFMLKPAIKKMSM